MTGAVAHARASFGRQPGEGRGGIKTELRRMLDRGEFDSYLQPRSQQQVLEGMLRLAIRPNPRPRPESWTDAPAPRYG